MGMKTNFFAFFYSGAKYNKHKWINVYVLEKQVSHLRLNTTLYAIQMPFNMVELFSLEGKKCILWIKFQFFLLLIFDKVESSAIKQKEEKKKQLWQTIQPCIRK